MRIGIFRQASAIVAVLMIVLSTMEGTQGDSLLRQERSTGERKLHFTNFPHNHRWPATIMPTSLSSQYYTDDLAINDNMIRDKKDLYDQEQKKEAIIEDTQTSVIAALDGSQALSSGATFHHKSLMAIAVQAVVIGSWLFWWEWNALRNRLLRCWHKAYCVWKFVPNNSAQ